MKVLSVAVPCYNSAAYMEKCIDSLLVAGEEIEIVIVNDGSTKDHTQQIADDYVMRYPHIIKAIHKTNGGHGSAVNAGLEAATGAFFKVVDSDDWVDETALKEVMAFLRQVLAEGQTLDMLVSNFVYDKQGAVHKRVMRYESILPEGTFFGWEEIKKFDFNHYILMHSVIYCTDLLRSCGLKLPEHTFYVDSIYVYYPLPFVKTMYYLPVTLYHYFIGREDQSVNEQVMISRIDQQLKVNKILYEAYDLEQISPDKLQHYMYRYLELITVVSSVLLTKENTAISLEKKAKLWQYMEASHPRMYKKLRYQRLLGWIVNLPGVAGRKIVVSIYHRMQQKIGFN